LDNGLTAGVDFDFDFVDDSAGLGADLESGGYVLYIESDMAALRFGDLDPVAEDNWGGVDGSAYDGFNDQDVHFDTVDFDAILVGEIAYGGIDGMISYGVDTDGILAAGVDELDAMQIYASGDFGNVSTELAYQADVAGTDEILALGASTTFGGADVGGAVVSADSGNSVGVDVAYPFGPITAGAYFTSNENDPDTYGFSVDYSEGPIAVNAFYDNDVDDTAGVEEFGVEGSYDVGNGLMVMAGYLTQDTFEDRFYVAGDYDLGSGAALLVSYAEDDDDVDGDEIGDPEYQRGTTVEVSFEF